MRSAGTEEQARVKVTAGHIGWADIIFVMEKKHQSRLQSKFSSELTNKSVIRLDIPDEFTYMDKELIEILYARVSEHINVPNL